MNRKRRSVTPDFKQEAASLVLDQGYTGYTPLTQKQTLPNESFDQDDRNTLPAGMPGKCDTCLLM